ncbi:DUF4249 domain-containing protein [Pleomorphovibrio marinus]|uniref:DUF4249 domain-containing protein n=1 Tax=Pleomorphovibrio marinus TaxID=2164132 RepID=UPI000E0B0948|nr:DUF4249 domain-containing protein [Pleomorphovibrio marinus]
MQQRITHIGIAILLLMACREPYEPELSSFDHNILVVEGYIDIGESPTQFRISRTNPIYGEVASDPQTQAQVSIEGEREGIWTLHNQGEGIYTLEGPLPQNQPYRLTINFENSSYASAFVEPILTPEIGRINFEKSNGGMKIYASTQGNEEARYFLWGYEETWIYRTPFVSYFEYDLELGDFVNRDQLLYQCWDNETSTRVIMESSEKYENNSINNKELLEIPVNSEKLGQRYSILVRQRAIDKDAFAFWENIRRNSDDIGDIFSPLPSFVRGNISNLNQAEEPVIGYVSAGISTEKRIFIDRSDAHPWNAIIPEYRACLVDTISMEDYERHFRVSINVPLYEWCGDFSAVCTAFLATTRNCTDCRMRGGTIDRPSFWEDLSF